MTQDLTQEDSIVHVYVYGEEGSGIGICTRAPFPWTFVESTIATYPLYTEGSIGTVGVPTNRSTHINAFSNYSKLSFGECDIWYPEVIDICGDCKIVYSFEAHTGESLFRYGLFAPIPLSLQINVSPYPQLASKSMYALINGLWQLRDSISFDNGIDGFYLPIPQTYVERRFVNSWTPEGPDFPECNSYSYYAKAFLADGTGLIWCPSQVYDLSNYSLSLFTPKLYGRESKVVGENGEVTLIEKWNFLSCTGIKKRIEISDGQETRVTRFEHSVDCLDGLDGMVLRSMAEKNIISPVVAKVDSAFGCEWRTRNRYSNVGSGFVPTAVELSKGNEKATLVRMAWTTHGNLSSIHNIGCPSMNMHWDSNELYLERLTETGLVSDSVFSWQYVHLPLIGLSRIKNPDGVTTNYYYDTHNRLTREIVAVYGPLYSYDYGLLTEGASANYIRKRFFLGSNYINSTLYYDGLGRDWLEVEESTSAGQSSAIMKEYDSNGRLRAQWTPIPISGTYITSVDEFKSSSASYYGDSEGFTSLRYGYRQGVNPDTIRRPGSYLHQYINPILSQTFVNEASGKFSCNNYKVGIDNCLHWYGSCVPGTLLIQSTTDEDGRQTMVFSNLFGEKILERRVLSSSQYADTYFVYDGYGLLRCIIPPKCTLALQSSVEDRWSVDENDDLWELAYWYEYDLKGNEVIRKLPGREKIIALCDSSFVPILRQDGNQRSRGVWSFVIPDGHMRNCVEGEVSLTSQEALAFVSSSPRASFTGFGPIYGYEILGPSSQPSLSSDIVTFYDSYSYLNQFDPEESSALSFQFSRGEAMYSNVIGRKTGEVVSGYPSSIYSDRIGNIIQKHSRSVFGDWNHIFSSYDRLAQPLNVEISHVGADGIRRVETQVNEYDSRGRLVSVKVSLDSCGPVTVKGVSYNALNRCTQSIMGGSAGSITYGYDCQGRTCSINSNYFSQDLLFERPAYSTTGNVTKDTWILGDEAQWQTYLYDRLNRIQSVRRKPNSSSSGILCQFNYDLNGNPTLIMRYGYADREEGEGIWGLIDNATFTYTGNRIGAIRDSADPLSYAGANDIVDGLTAYSWDANGNMVSDSGRDISEIRYDRNDLPVYFKVGSWMSVSFERDALGRKLAEIDTVYGIPPIPSVIPPSLLSALSSDISAPAPPRMAIRTDYVYNWRYKNGALDRIGFPGGYATLDTIGFQFHYYIQDYLGNIRAVVSHDGVLEEANDYYPFGLLMPGEDGELPSFQTSKYGTKELITAHGLYYQDFEARFLDPTTARFLSQDKLCEKSPHISPYVFCADNPINIIDPLGLDTLYFDAKGCFQERVACTDRDCIAIRQESGKIQSTDFKYGTIKEVKTFGLGKGESFDMLKVRGDDNGTRAFEFLAKNTGVEWSHAMMGIEGERGLNFLTSSHNSLEEAGMSHLIRCQLQFGYTARRFNHGHPSGNTEPSGKKKKKGDRYFARDVNRIFNASLDYNIYTPGDDQYTKYTPIKE